MKPTPDDCVHLTVEIVLEIHSQALKNFGGSPGIRDEGLLASAVFAPQSTFGGKSPFADIIEVAAAYLFYLCCNHPFVDGNKRTGHAAMERFLTLNGFELKASVDDAEVTILAIASNNMAQDEFFDWVEAHIVPVA